MFSFHLTFKKQFKENYFQIEDLKMGKNYEPSQNWMRIIYCKGFQVRPITQMDQDAKNLFIFYLQNILNERHKQTFKQTLWSKSSTLDRKVEASNLTANSYILNERPRCARKKETNLETKTKRKKARPQNERPSTRGASRLEKKKTRKTRS